MVLFKGPSVKQSEKSDSIPSPTSLRQASVIKSVIRILVAAISHVQKKTPAKLALASTVLGPKLHLGQGRVLQRAGIDHNASTTILLPQWEVPCSLCLPSEGPIDACSSCQVEAMLEPLSQCKLPRIVFACTAGPSNKKRCSLGAGIMPPRLMLFIFAHLPFVRSGHHHFCSRP